MKAKLFIIEKEQFSKNYPFKPETTPKNNREFNSNTNNKVNMMKKPTNFYLWVFLLLISLNCTTQL